MSITMSGLRIYINTPAMSQTSDVDTGDDKTVVDTVFYSRRGNGPIYRWLYEEQRSHWRALRMNTSEFDSHKLSNASWKTVPESLQAQLGAHYLD
jgi:hypothetical protein